MIRMVNQAATSQRKSDRYMAHEPHGPLPAIQQPVKN
jgi:hypothetical protein